LVPDDVTTPEKVSELGEWPSVEESTKQAPVTKALLDDLLDDFKE
jgi:hypothetical protein